MDESILKTGRQIDGESTDGNLLASRVSPRRYNEKSHLQFLLTAIHLFPRLSTSKVFPTMTTVTLTGSLALLEEQPEPQVALGLQEYSPAAG